LSTLHSSRMLRVSTNSFRAWSLLVQGQRQVCLYSPAPQVRSERGATRVLDVSRTWTKDQPTRRPSRRSTRSGQPPRRSGSARPRARAAPSSPWPRAPQTRRGGELFANGGRARDGAAIGVDSSFDTAGLSREVDGDGARWGEQQPAAAPRKVLGGTRISRAQDAGPHHPAQRLNGQRGDGRPSAPVDRSQGTVPAQRRRWAV